MSGNIMLICTSNVLIQDVHEISIFSTIDWTIGSIRIPENTGELPKWTQLILGLYCLC